MFLRKQTSRFTESCSDKIKNLKDEIETADAIVIGAGSGLSAAAGLTYSGERFRKYFSDFAAKYPIRDMYSGGFYPFADMEEFWAWWSRHIQCSEPCCQKTYDNETLIKQMLEKQKDMVIIKYPFWQMTKKNPKAVYACINYGEAICPNEIKRKSICINEDIGDVIKRLDNANGEETFL